MDTARDRGDTRNGSGLTPVPSRRSLARALAVLGASGCGLVTVAASSSRELNSRVPLYSQAVAFTAADGPIDRALALRGVPIPSVARGLWQAGDPPLVAGTRVREDAVGADALVQATQRFVDAGRQSPGGADADLETSALLDVHSLTWALASPVAGWSPPWRYTWPRDTAHVIVALHERGLSAWALELLEVLARMQNPDGTFEARYVPGTSRVPDERPAQSDGVGFFLWAAERVLRTATSRVHVSDHLDRAVTRAGAALMDATENRARLPAPSPDYWERRERRLTLASAAMTLAGLRAATELTRLGIGTGEAVAGTRELSVGVLSRRLDEVRDAVVRAFAPRGFQRYQCSGGLDAGLFMLLPPYDDGTLMASNPVVATRVGDAHAAMSRAAGGVSPGASWKRDGISWTPQTTMLAQAYAHLGQWGQARTLVQWVGEHRTSAGAIPEKVLASGAPAAVAPLAWSSAVTLSTLRLLSRRD